VCGKDASTAALQDLQLHFNIGLAQWATAIKEKGAKIPEETKALLVDSTFATLTNVNFDSARFFNYLKRANAVRDSLIKEAKLIGVDSSRLTGPANFQYRENEAFLLMEAKHHGVVSRKAKMGDDNAMVVREMALYGIKGTAAYFDHAERLRKLNPSAYSSEDSEAVYDKLFTSLAALAPEKPALGTMLETALGVGALNLKVMELLDSAHTKTFGHPVPTTVSTIPSEGKCLLVSGHDIADTFNVLKQTAGSGVNVYTHGEMLPAHSYPELKKFPHFKGHFGTAWQRQKIDFLKFPGAILLTSNCLIEPLPQYKDRVFTTNSVGFSGVKHVENFDYSSVIDYALKAPGFKASDCTKKSSTADNLVIGFGHNTVMSVAGKVIEAVEAGQLKNIFVIGGCDGSEGERNYFTRLGEQLPKDAMALTVGCGKFRINGLDMGSLPNGIPRLLDMGQCNDSYGAVKVALALANAFKTDVNGLPLHFAISWFEQKAVAVLLTLLHLNVQNIYLGPNLPAFLTPAVLDVLVDKFKIKPTNNAHPEKDLAQMLARTAPK
jgi:hydroxylamine reductase